MTRIGHGLDAHRFSADPRRRLVLGGVVVPGSAGLEGHSDADVAAHALGDAILGAAGLGTLGARFPADATPEGADSLGLLDACGALARGAGLVLESAQVTIVAEHPRLSPHLDAMAANLTRAAGGPVAVGATTTDGLGSIGRGEGIAASAVCLLVDPAGR